MATFEVVEAKAYHCGRMARAVRKEQAEAATQSGIDPHRGLRACFQQSSFRRAWLIDGQLAAVGGVIGSPLACVGYVWLGISRVGTRHRKALLVEARRQLEGLMTSKTSLVAAILDGDPAARRFCEHLGFRPVGRARFDASEATEMVLDRELM